jgi:PPOX class probable F420-dependent enzyme
MRKYGWYLIQSGGFSMANSFSALEGKKYMSLTTFRKSGVGVPTAVWFAEVNGKVVVTTSAISGKAKRIRNNPCVTVAPSNGAGKVTGPAVEAEVRILSAAEIAAAEQALKRKYGWQKSLFEGFLKITGKMTEHIYLEISPR